MKQIYTLKELHEELIRQNQNKWDRIIKAEEMQFISSEYDIFLKIKNPFNIEVHLPLNSWAHQQLANKLQIPLKYYNRMLNKNKFKLLANNINTWLEDEPHKKYLIRVLDNKVRAILSDRYYYIENLDILYFLLEKLKSYDNVIIQECALTETRMYIKAVQKYNEIEIKKNDVVVPGLILQNSEVGASRLVIKPFLLRKICSNGLIGTFQFGKIHLGRRQEEGVIIWSERTHRLESDLIKSQIADIISQCFNQDLINKWVEAIRKSTEFKIDDRYLACEAIKLNFNLSEEEKQQLINHFVEEEANQWGLANGITRMAKNAKDYDRRVELEEIGNEIILTPPEKLEKWMEEAKKLVRR